MRNPLGKIRFVDFILRKKLLEKKRQEEQMVPALPEVDHSNFVKGFSCTHVAGEVWVYKWGAWYHLVVVGSYGGKYIDAFFKLKGRHRKYEAAERRAIRVAKTWGEE